MPKKGKGKKEKKPPPPEDPNALNEVDKAFYELQITDLNRKLARLRTLTQELEDKNTNLQENNTKLDEDRADVITYLKRTLQEKTDEIIELQERLKAQAEKSTEEVNEYQEKIFNMEQEYKQMQEQLTSEIKLLNGKLNALEEFRLQRDDIMKKYEEQENKMEEQEFRHKREIYSIERKFIIGKDKLKKEMEARLLQLSTEFQDVTDVRVAATTHRVIRENIAINNEINQLLDTQKRLQTENERLRLRDRELRLQAELHGTEKMKAISKVKTQVLVITDLTNKHADMSEKLETFNEMQAHTGMCLKQLEVAQRNMDEVQYKMRLLEQNLHASRCERAKIGIDLVSAHERVCYYTNVVTEAMHHIKKLIGLKDSHDDSESSDDDSEANEAIKGTLLQRVFELLADAQKHVFHPASVDSVGDCAEIYGVGDLGFVPKKVEIRSRFPVKRNAEIQQGPSFEEFLLARQLSTASEHELVSSEASVSVEAEEVEVVSEEESQVLFSGELSTDAMIAAGLVVPGDVEESFGTLSDEEEEEEDDEQSMVQYDLEGHEEDETVTE